MDWTSRYKELKITRRGEVLIVTLNNPPLNPMTPGMHSELTTIFADADRDTESRVVILTGAENGFSAGGNVKTLLTQIEDRAYHRSVSEEAPRIIKTMLAMRKPLIARVNGHAIGLGATLALYCDIVIAVESAKIADMHVAVGLSAGDGGALIWPQLIGFAKARYYLLTGDAMTASEAAECGLIAKAVPADKLDEEVDKLADRLVAGPSAAISATKQSINMLLQSQAASVLDAHIGLELSTMLSDDHAEALRATAEKRPAQFKDF